MHTNRLRFFTHSFKGKLLISLLLASLLPLSLVSIFYQNLLEKRISRDIETSSIEKLRYTSLNIERQIEISEQLMGWITYNTQLTRLLSQHYSSLSEKQLDIINFSSHVLEYAVNANIESSIFKILILSNDGSSFQIGNGMSLLDQAAISESGWLETYHRSQADRLVLSKDLYAKDTYIFPMSNKIYSNTTGKPLGWCLITFQQDMYSKTLNSSANSELYLINAGGQCIASKDSEQIGIDLSRDTTVSEILHSQSETGYVTGERNGNSYIAHFYRVPKTNIIEIQETQLEDYYAEKLHLFHVSLFLVVLSVGLSLCMIAYLSHMLTQPIGAIRRYIENVCRNSSPGTLELPRDDEFRSIAESINKMELEIVNLLEEQKRESEIKKDLEFRMLQNQINPHFLYNTLNTIRWLASLQHADTIRDLTASLGRLLQNISKGSDKITIYEEMSLLDDYVMIQDIKYDGKITVNYHIKSPEVTQAFIIKFVFQPIVENAIFHGIEPKEDGIGTIDITLERVDNDVIIHIVDNGIGMTAEQTHKLLFPDQNDCNHRGLNGIGISNINTRLAMTYGVGYGLSITSAPGLYTDVQIRIPYEREEGSL